MATVATADSSSSPLGFVAASGYKFSEKDQRPVRLRLKKRPKAVEEELQRDEDASEILSEDETKDKDKNDGAKPPSPILPEMDSKTASLFPTGKPRETVLDTVICKHCKKPVLRVNAAEHIRGCMKAKQEKQRKKKEARDLANRLKYGDKEEDIKKKTSLTGKDDEEDDHHHPSSALTGQKATKKSTAADDVAGNKKGKKRKADAAAADDASQADTKDPAAATTGPGKKKKKKDEPAHPPKKPAKSKGPVDVERQCGVTLPNGGQCARSLTCKSHSMGAKRAVPGRSLPYDMLLQAYQKKNQARQQKAAIDANAPVVDDEDARAGKVDSDEEKERCMRGIERMWAGRKSQALVSHRLVGTRYKYRMVRVRDMFAQALGGAGLFAGAGSPGAEPHGHAHTSQEGNAMFTGFGLGLFGSGLGSGRIFGPDPVVLSDGQNSTAQQHTQPPAPGAASAASPNPSSASGLPRAHANLPSPATPGAGHNSTPNGGSRGGTPTTTAAPGHAAGGGGGGVGSTPAATANANAKRNSSVSMSMAQQAQVNAAAAAAAATAAAASGGA